MSKVYVYKDKKDGRLRYVGIDDNGNRIGGSYPRILMEQSLGRPLNPNEDVHHIDGDVTNNDISNLEVRQHGEHQREHSTKYIDTTEICMICGCEFTMNSVRWSRFYADLKRGRSRVLTCSKSCAGKASSGAYRYLYDLKCRLDEVEKLWLK